MAGVRVLSADSFDISVMFVTLVMSLMVVGHLQSILYTSDVEEENINGTVRSAYFQLIALLHFDSNFRFIKLTATAIADN